MTTKEEVVSRIEKIDEIRTILDDIRRSEMAELEEIEVSPQQGNDMSCRSSYRSQLPL